MLWVLATTTPYDLVKPLADALGFDDVVATRYGVRPDGSYDGSVAGPFVWSSGKLRCYMENRMVLVARALGSCSLPSKSHLRLCVFVQCAHEDLVVNAVVVGDVAVNSNA